MLAITPILIICFIQLSNSFLAPVQNQITRRAYGIPIMALKTLSPRKELFFEIVASGLLDRFPDQKDIPRIVKFCQYAKSEISIPSSTKYLHEPIEEYIDNLRAHPWWNPSEFSWVEELEKNSEIINNELKSVLDTEKQLFKGDSRYQSTMGKGWTAFRLQRLGEWNENNIKKFPCTTKLIQSINIPLAVRGVMFAKQAPSTYVQSHSDGRNFILTAHLGLDIPPSGCWIEVGGKRKEWEQNKVIIFDTSFSHETGNESSQNRYVLIIDFWHPDLTLLEQKALEFIYDSRNKFESGRVNEIDCSWVKEGKPLDVESYLKSKSDFGNVFNMFGWGK
mmetsp:Transcript_2238/g.2333  ORF Transcript_2238/g.2333 Transcript_2238/m.2333 type:complete len:335 (+) Transcript_2238:77-1081(+)